MSADVDQSSTTSAQFFDHADTSLGISFAPPLAGELSFLGAFTSSGSPAIAHVRITGGMPRQDQMTTGQVALEVARSSSQSSYMRAKPTTS